MHVLTARLRQLRFPRPFRIAGGKDDYDALLLSALATLAQVTRDAVSPSPASVAEAADMREAMPSGFVVALSNEMFRLKRNADLMARAGDTKEIRSIRRTLEKLQDALREHGIECLDLSGQAYDVGRVDFEPFGAAERIADVDSPRIGTCERPAVLLHGRLIQKARGTVALPLDPAEREVSS